MIGRRLQYKAMTNVLGPLLFFYQRWQRRQARRSPRRDVRENPFGPALALNGKLREIMTLNYLSGRYADGAVPVAWVTSGFPVELLRPFDYHVVYPENHAALCAAQHLVPELSSAAEINGYSQDLCSYARTDLGGLLSGKTPVGRLPRPDLLCCCTNICQTVLYWYRTLANHFQCPLVLIDTPFVYGKMPEHHLTYVRDQFSEAFATAAKVAGRPADLDRLKAVAAFAKEAALLWGDCLAVNRARPAPWTGFDQFAHMAPIVTMRGSEACVSYYRELRDELRHRAQQGIGGIREERVRLIWDNLPIWHDLRGLSTMFAEKGFTFVATTYTNTWAVSAALVDPNEPINSMAKAYSQILLNRDLANRLSIVEQMCGDYAARGIVLHSDRSCKPYSIGHVDIRERMVERLGLRALLLEADHADPRAYARGTVETRVQAFMESLGAERE